MIGKREVGVGVGVSVLVGAGVGLCVTVGVGLGVVVGVKVKDGAAVGIEVEVLVGVAAGEETPAETRTGSGVAVGLCETGKLQDNRGNTNKIIKPSLCSQFPLSHKYL